MKKAVVTILSFAFLGFNASYAQVGIGTTSPEPGAALEVASTNKGLLPPRLTTEQRNNMNNLVAGLAIYNSDTNCLEVYNGSVWQNLCNTPIPNGTNPEDLLVWSGSEWTLLPVGEEGSILRIVNGKPTWAEPAGSVEFGFEDQFNLLTLALDGLTKTSARIKIQLDFGTNLNPNITSISLLLSTNPNPIPVNSSEHSIDLQDLLEEYVNQDQVNLNNLTENTTYYYRLIINNQYVSETVNFFRTYQFQLGDSFQGGILAYIFEPFEDGFVNGQMHGFVVAESDLTEQAEWGCEGTHLPGMITGGFPDSTAAQNQAIINGCASADIAAKLCANLTLNGYSDWLLPSKDVINNGIRKNEVLSNLTGISTGYYWSCTPHSNNPATSAWATNISNGSNIQAPKSNTYSIRPVRQF